YDGYQLLDVTGPAAAFAWANKVLKRSAYAVQVASPSGGLVPSSSGIAIQTTSLARVFARPVDTFLIAGAEISVMRDMIAGLRARQRLRRWAESASRFGSVCSGAYILASLGLADGKRIATHWASCSLLAELFPDVNVDSDALFAVDGRLWSSAGVTTGIDMALAMIEADVGFATANELAKLLVLYMRRPGYQSQFSTILRAQVSREAPFAE